MRWFGRLVALTTLLLLVTAIPLVAQTRLPRVLVLEDSLHGTEEQEIRRPVALAAASAEEIAVADAHGPRLLLFHKVGVTWQLDQSVPLPGAPVGMAYDGSRYVVSMRARKGLVAFEGPQLLQRRIGLPKDVEPGPLAAWPDGRLLVYDYVGRRALELSSEGLLKAIVEIDGRVTALATRPDGGFFAALGQEATVLRYGASRQLSSVWEIPGVEPVPAWPAALAVELGGDVLIVDRHVSRLLVLDVGGKPVGIGSRRGWERGLLLFPNAIARLGEERFLVSDTGNGRVQIFRRTDNDTTP